MQVTCVPASHLQTVVSTGQDRRDEDLLVVSVLSVNVFPSGFKSLRVETRRRSVQRTGVRVKSEVASLLHPRFVDLLLKDLDLNPLRPPFPVSAEVSVGLNQAVRLECERPSNLAVLSWTHSQMESLPQTLFIRSPDGSLSFLASAQTLGSYSCEAEEAGLKEVVVSYTVLLKPTPRSIGPHPGVEKDFEDIPTETPTPEGSENTPDHPAPETTATAVPRMKASPDVPTASESKTNPPSFRTDSQISLEAPQAERSYLGALQVVSVLLAVCICVIFMGAFFTLRQRKAGLRSCHLLPVKDGSKKDNSMEISSLGSRKEASTELNDGE